MCEVVVCEFVVCEVVVCEVVVWDVVVDCDVDVGLVVVVVVKYGALVVEEVMVKVEVLVVL